MTLKIKQLPKSERPYEKLEMYGEKMLSNAELLAIIIKSGTKENTSVDLANKILSLQQNYCNGTSLQSLQNISIEEFQKIKGIGKVKALQLKAVCELARRMSLPLEKSKIKIKSSQDVANLFIDELRFEKVEYVKMLILNTKNMLIRIVDISKGGTNLAIIEPKEVLQEAIKSGHPRIIIIHNHPSGDSTPSKADIDVTKRLYQAAKIVGIQLLDHIVIGDRCYTSIFSIERIVEK